MGKVLLMLFCKNTFQTIKGIIVTDNENIACWTIDLSSHVGVEKYTSALLFDRFPIWAQLTHVPLTLRLCWKSVKTLSYPDPEIRLHLNASQLSQLLEDEHKTEFKHVSHLPTSDTGTWLVQGTNSYIIHMFPL